MTKYSYNRSLAGHRRTNAFEHNVADYWIGIHTEHVALEIQLNLLTVTSWGSIKPQAVEALVGSIRRNQHVVIIRARVVDKLPGNVLG